MILYLGVYINYFYFLAFLDYRDPDATIETYEFSSWTSSSRQLLIELLIEDFKFVALENYNFESLDLSKLITFLEFSASQDSAAKEKKWWSIGKVHIQ